MIVYHTIMEGFAERWQVFLFLVLFKQLAQRTFTFADRKSSLDAIGHLGITIQQAKQEVLALTPEDYYRGPIADASTKGGEFWEFGRRISGQEVFIKLKAVEEQGAAICFAFHPPEKPIEYPYRDK
jgi:hypothetical protein